MEVSWEELHRRAKALEGLLEVLNVYNLCWADHYLPLLLQKKIQSYSSLAQRINANFLDDEGT